MLISKLFSAPRHLLSLWQLLGRYAQLWPKGPVAPAWLHVTQPGLGGGMRNNNGNRFIVGTRSEISANNLPPLRPFVEGVEACGILTVEACKAETRSYKFPLQHFGCVAIPHIYALSSTGMWQSKPFWRHFTEGGN